MSLFLDMKLESLVPWQYPVWFSVNWVNRNNTSSFQEMLLVFVSVLQNENGCHLVLFTRPSECFGLMSLIMDVENETSGALCTHRFSSTTKYRHGYETCSVYWAQCHLHNLHWWPTCVRTSTWVKEEQITKSLILSQPGGTNDTGCYQISSSQWNSWGHFKMLQAVSKKTQERLGWLIPTRDENWLDVWLDFKDAICLWCFYRLTPSSPCLIVNTRWSGYNTWFALWPWPCLT